MPTASQIEDLLPQTQCQQCGYEGCAPYAQALARGQAPINLCPPGGDTVIHELAALMHTPPLPLAQPKSRRKSPRPYRRSRLHRLHRLHQSLPC